MQHFRKFNGQPAGISAIYARTARDDMTKMDWQVSVCAAFARLRGWEEIEVYADSAASGTTGT